MIDNWRLGITNARLSDMEISDQTFFEIECVSGTTLCVILTHQYITVAHNKYHKRFVTRKLLTIVFICVILTSFLWATLDTVFKARVKTVKLAKLYMALPAEKILAFGIALNLPLLKNGKVKRQNLSVQRALDSSLYYCHDTCYRSCHIFTNNHLFKYCSIFIYYIQRCTIYPEDMEGFTLCTDTMPVKCDTKFGSLFGKKQPHQTLLYKLFHYYYKLFHCATEVKKTEPTVSNVILDAVSPATVLKSRNASN